mmetsp:Transcript_29391/g.89902  ORF Transcript_29391/g.89902 Transcript_29391/m.89902 type:complete len:211 (-) Transcript_29391:1445-2077(-)
MLAHRRRAHVHVRSLCREDRRGNRQRAVGLANWRPRRRRLGPKLCRGHLVGRLALYGTPPLQKGLLRSSRRRQPRLRRRQRRGHRAAPHLAGEVAVVQGRRNHGGRRLLLRDERLLCRGPGLASSEHPSMPIVLAGGLADLVHAGRRLVPHRRRLLLPWNGRNRVPVLRRADVDRFLDAPRWLVRRQRRVLRTGLDNTQCDGAGLRLGHS